MNINLELYRVFLSVANNNNITKAAKELNISQPAISKSIKNLEESLGGKLFIRTKRGVTLTKEGEELYKYVSKGLEYIGSAESKFAELINLRSGTIRIGIGTTLTKEFLLPYIKRFHKEYPNINIEINTNLWSELIPKLRNGLIDMIILNISDIKYDSDIEIEKCKKIKDCFIVNRELYNEIDKEISLKDLNRYPLILLSKRSSSRISLDNYCKNKGVILEPKIELTSYSLITEFTKIGMGIGYATREFIKDDLKNKELFELKIKEDTPERYIGIALSKNNLPNFSTKKMIELIKNN